MNMRNNMMNRIKKINGEVSMRMKMPKFHNSGWKRRISRVLIFTMLCSTFMYPGWYNPKKAHANPGTRIKTVTYFAGQHESATDTLQFSDTNLTFPAFNVNLPETGATVRSAYSEVMLQYGGVTANITGILLSADNWTSSVSLNATPVGSLESQIVVARQDVTSRFSGYVPGSNLSFTIGYRVNQGAATAQIVGANAKLIVTYEYNDTSATQLNTVIYPLRSTTAGDQGTKRAQLAAAGTAPFTYNVALGEAGVTNVQNWFDVYAEVAAAAATDHTFTANINGGTATGTHRYEEALSANGGSYRWLVDSVSGFAANTSQTFNYVADATNPVNIIGGEANYTYTFNNATSTAWTKTARYGLGEINTAVNATKVSKSVTVSLPESGVTVKDAWFRIRTSSGAADTLSMTTTVGAGAESAATAYAIALASNEIQDMFIIHAIPTTELANIADGTQLTLSTQWTTGGGATSAELLITYQYTGTPAYQNTAQIFAGQQAVAAATTYAYSTLNTYFPETSGKTMKSAFLDATYTDVATAATSIYSSDIGGTGAITSTAEMNNENMTYSGYHDVTSQITASNATYTANYTCSLATKHTGVLVYTYMADPTPPVAGTVTVSPDGNGYTSSAPTITTAFTEDGSAVSGCEYTTNNGSTWFAGVVSGSSPNYTCTANPTGLSAALTINMRATSGGGTGTGIAINRTVDTTGPTDVSPTITITAGGEQNALSWTAATDSGVGLRTTNTYDVRYLTGATPPTCSTGTSIYLGTALSYTHTDLSGGTQYSYRVCAYDKANNVSTGATGSGTPKYASATTSCGRCHGYGAAFTDGTARNNPAGKFMGSHNKHVVSYSNACSVCHMVPATTSSSDYGHRNGNIQMANPINGDTGAAYTKGPSWEQTNAPSAFTGCTSTYCHSQGVSKTSESGDTRSMSAPLASLNWAGTGACSSCHGNPPSYTNGDTTWGAAKRNSHGSHTTACQTCHNSTTTNGTSIASTALHANRYYNINGGNGATISSYTYSVGGGTCNTVSCHANPASPQWGVTVADCTTCHSVAVGTRRAITGEFALTWNHGAADKYDCGVCHMEGAVSGSVTTGKVDLAYHGNGTIELRDPNTGTTMQGVTWGGAGAGSYTSTGLALPFTKFSRNLDSSTLEEPVKAIQINHCLHCHDADGSVVTAPTGTPGNPFGSGVAPLNVDAQFNTANASYHPVKGKQNNSYANANTMNTPWNYTKTAGNNTSYGYLMSCFDCHAASGATGTQSSTVVAHGGAVTLRALYDRPTAGPTAYTKLCVVCHRQSLYWGTTVHSASNTPGGPGFSALNTVSDPDYEGGYHVTNGSETSATGCTGCHGTGLYNVAPTRPQSAENAHGSNTNGLGGNWTSGARPYSFIRNTSHISDWNTGASASCTMNNGCGSTRGPFTYTPGGTY